MSFNVQVYPASILRKLRVSAIVKKYFPDMIGFQEASPLWMIFLSLAFGSKYGFVGEGRNLGGAGERNPIFYSKKKFKLIESGTRWLSETPEKVSKFKESSLNRIFTYAILEDQTDGERVLVVNTHLDHISPQACEKQALVLLKFLQNYADFPVILMGDFNSEKTSKAYLKITETNLSDSFDLAGKTEAFPTYTNYGTAKNILDHIFVRKQKVTVDHYQVCGEKIYGNFPSDHHPVLIDFSLI